MIINKGIIIRLNPTDKQKILFEKHFGGTRFIWNYFSFMRKENYLKDKKGSTYVKDCKMLTKLKKKSIFG